MCFVWISEQTAIISLYSINWLVFITETECVYCAVRTECLYMIQVNVSIKKYGPCLRWFEAGLTPWRRGFDPRSVHVKSVLNKVALGQFCVQVLRFLHVRIISTMLRTDLYLHVALTRKDKRAKPGNLPKAMLFGKSGSVG
jgi:hypothetical protein